MDFEIKASFSLSGIGTGRVDYESHIDFPSSIVLRVKV